MTASKPYFKNLDALRFIAFLGVFMAHVWSMQVVGMQVSGWMKEVKTLSQAGGLGLNFLFILSSFLITYLLLIEEKANGKFSIPKYYVRRTLRIWPLYFLVIIFSFIALPFIMNATGKPFHETASVLPFIFFYSNFYILSAGYPYSPMLAVMWSLAVEEQFYVVWPWVLKGFKRFRSLIFLVLIFISLGFRFIYVNESKVLFFNTLSLLSDFAAGGWLALEAAENGRFFQRITSLSKFAIVTIYTIIFILIIFYDPLFQSAFMIIIERIIFAAAFSFIIIEQAFCTNRIFNFSAMPGFAWLGKISFGMYCIHELLIVLTKDLLIHIGIFYQPAGHFIYLPVIAFSIIVPMAAVSYYLYEKPFLNWKRKFEIV